MSIQASALQPVVFLAGALDTMFVMFVAGRIESEKDSPD
jgi:hypothetical protein